jgi:predicted metalloprotease with PDZ domain
MYKVSLFLFASLFFSVAHSQNKAVYQYTLDLVNVNNDQVAVELKTPPISKKTINFYLPKVIPGYYNESDFGRFIDDFKAWDKKGNALAVTKPDINTWTIGNANRLNKITYRVNDTYDDEDLDKAIFEPCGSNIRKDTNFIINNHCFLGYFEGMKQLPYQLTVLHPATLFGTTAMDDADRKNTSDLFTAESYNRIVDNPIMYAAPDTASIKVGESTIIIGIYSPNKKVSAKYLAENSTKLMQAQASYLGGKLPVKKYAFLMYLSETPGLIGATGALEHSYSSTYFTPEDEPENILQFFKDNATHEFFHILTPLNIHSEEIHYFDFIHPKMSKHLWLYEGTTEYHATMVQQKYGIISKEEYLDVMSQKITRSRRLFNDSLSFTEMSVKCLHEYANQFANVYDKGALIGLCMDIKLRQLSNGKYGIMNLINDLSKKFGKNKPFKDDELFNEIEKLTYPQIKAFLNIYVAGTKPLPLVETFAAAGVLMQPLVETKDSVFTLGGGSFAFNATSNRWVVGRTPGVNVFGRKIGLQPGDEMYSVNGAEVTAQNFGQIASGTYKAAHIGDPLTLVVFRKNSSSGMEEKITLSAPMMKIPVMKFNQLSFMPHPTSAQQALQNSWLVAK